MCVKAGFLLIPAFFLKSNSKPWGRGRRQPLQVCGRGGSQGLAAISPPPRKAAQFVQLQAAETFCLGKSQECGEAGIEQVLECMRAFMQSLTR